MTSEVLRIALASPKPGVGKTTSALFICQHLHEQGWKVLCVDADAGRSALEWMEDAGGLDYPVIGQHVTTLHRSLVDLEDGFNAVVVDVPQFEDHAAIARSALVYADVWLYLLAPSGIEVRRTMRKLPTAVTEVRDLREQVRGDRNPLVEAVLLTRTNRAYATKTGPDADVRGVLDSPDIGLTVLQSQIAHHDELYRQCYGLPIDLSNTTYPAVANELVTMWKAVR